MDIDLTLSPEKIQQVAGVATTHVNAYVAELRRLFLVEDLVDSLKFALLLWLLTYIGAIFNGMTVVILCKFEIFKRELTTLRAPFVPPHVIVASTSIINISLFTAYVAMFTLPKVYETNKQNIDQYLDLVRSKIVEITDKWVDRR